MKKNHFFCCVLGGVWYLLLMNDEHLTTQEKEEVLNAIMQHSDDGMRSGWGYAIKQFEQWQERFNARVEARIAAEK
jgi:hypothetical protein